MEEKNSEIKVIILDNNITMSEINNVKIIRIKDKEYNLLVMKDYWPVLGTIDGSIYIEGDDEVSFENINGFYSLSSNVFHLIIKDRN